MKNTNMNILLIGQTTLHWGRMEYGNIGNYYIIEPFIRELHNVFSKAIIKTTLQMTDDFCQRERVVRLPMELYYSWDDNQYLDKCIKELGIANLFNKTNKILSMTPYIKEVLNADLVIDFSGDIWGDNADFLGSNRFLIGLIKNRVAQLLRKKTAMLAGSPGPFKNHLNDFTKEVFENFDIVTNRENISSKLLSEDGFNTKNVINLVCPAFLFEPEKEENMLDIYHQIGLDDDNIKKIGFIICGWNLKEGPFDKKDIKDKELLNFVETIEFILQTDKTKIFLMSHSNGFELPPNFKLIKGRDFPFAQQLYNILEKRNVVNIKNVVLLDGLYNPWETKAIIGKLNILISGRIHAAVAALSQSIPTVIIDYGHEPKAHKLEGFANVMQVIDYVSDPNNLQDILDKVKKCLNNEAEIKKHLTNRIKKVKEYAKKNFLILKDFYKNNNK